MYSSFFVHCCGDPRYLHSFPTRRSSDLQRDQGALARSPRSVAGVDTELGLRAGLQKVADPDRKSTRLNSSHSSISYAVFCLKKKKKSVTDNTWASDSSAFWRSHLFLYLT